MKKFFIAVLALFCLTTVSQAQTQQYYKLSHRNEISASYGASFFGSVMGGVISKANDLFGFMGVDDTKFKVSGSKGWINLGKLKPGINFYTLMTTAKFDWFRTRSDVFGMYSKVCVGGFIGNFNKDFSTLFDIPDRYRTFGFVAPHISLIGLEVGKSFSGFMELGVGMQGVVQAGIRARF